MWFCFNNPCPHTPPSPSPHSRTTVHRYIWDTRIRDNTHLGVVDVSCQPAKAKVGKRKPSLLAAQNKEENPAQRLAAQQQQQQQHFQRQQQQGYLQVCLCKFCSSSCNIADGLCYTNFAVFLFCFTLPNAVPLMGCSQHICCPTAVFLITTREALGRSRSPALKCCPYHRLLSMGNLTFFFYRRMEGEEQELGEDEPSPCQGSIKVHPPRGRRGFSPM